MPNSRTRTSALRAQERYVSDLIDIDDDDDWGRRRGNMRHEVQIPARITDRLGDGFEAVIEDVSSTGMLLGIEMVTAHDGRDPLQADSLATLEFTPDPQGAPESRVSIPVRVMWRAPVALGVRFEHIGPALREALRVIAEAAVKARVVAAEARRPQLTARQRATLQACRKTVQKQLPNLIWVMRTELVKSLRLAAASAGEAEASTLLADADACEAASMAMARTIEHQVLAGFAEASDLDETQELTMMQFRQTSSGSTALGVLNAPAVDHGSHITALAHTVEERYKTRFFELNVRLANVLGHPLDTGTNPLVPATLCRIFWNGVVSRRDSSAIQKHLHQVILRQVMPLVGDLYEVLNKTLDDEGAGRIFDVRRDDSRRPPR